MPRHPGKKKSGRKRKFEFGDIAYSEKYGWVVIVDHIKFFNSKEYYYKVIRVLHRFNGSPYGRAVWVKNYRLRKPTEEEAKYNTTRMSVRTIYRGNQKLDAVEGGRGCKCNCCVHTAIKPSMVLGDGTYKGDDDGEV